MNRTPAQPALWGRAKDAFTLVEMILVIGLIALLAGLVIGNVDKIFGENQAQLAHYKVNESFKAPLTSYRIHMGRYPTTSEGLEALLKRPEGDQGRWRGPYIESEKDLLDPWGNKLQYRYPGSKREGSYDLFSHGPDGKESDDDIGNW